jgi:alpha-glucosidase (family GH31 glycosyl hydrolase)
MLGPDLLLAPIVIAGVKARTVTLPPGSWVEALKWARIAPQVTPTTYQAGLDRDLSVTG